jgi:hypothetical protein
MLLQRDVALDGDLAANDKLVDAERTALIDAATHLVPGPGK